jgi:hypothetical protein
MTDQSNPTPPRREASERSGFSTARSAPVAATDSRLTGGSGVQRSHLKDRKSWLKSRTRAGRTWAQRKAASVTYCPAKKAA